MGQILFPKAVVGCEVQFYLAESYEYIVGDLCTCLYVLVTL